MSPSSVTVEQKTFLTPRRFFGAWALFTFWLGLVPIVIAPAYYGLTKPSDFDAMLQSLRRDGLVWFFNLIVGAGFSRRVRLQAAGPRQPVPQGPHLFGGPSNGRRQAPRG